MLPTLSRFCHLLERELLIAIRRRRYTFQIAPIYSKSKSFKSRDPLINQMLSKKNGAVRERRQSWLVDEKVCMHLREEILLKPKFVRQMVMSIPVLESTELDKVLSRCKEDLQNLSVVDDLHSLLSDIIMVINHLDKNHVMPLLEEKCCLRLSSWTVKEILWTMDMFYACQWRAARFYRSSFKWFDLKLSDLDIQPDDLVQLLFYVAFYRNAPITLMRQIEEILAHQSGLHSPAELGLICHAFFVTNTSILSHDLLEMLSRKLIEGISSNRLKPALIGNYLKVLRHAQYEDGVLYQQICDGFVRRFNRLNRYATMQLFKLLSSLHFHHGDYCATFVKYWEGVDLHRAAPRFKTLVDILSSCIVFQVKPPENVINQIMDVVETRHRELSNLYPEKYIESLVALVQTDRFPFEAISHALSPRVEKDNVVLEQLYQCQLIDESVEILCPEYKGYRLPERWIAQFQKYKTNLLKQVDWRQGLQVIFHTLRLILGNCIRVDTVLLSSQVPVLLLKVDENNVAISLSDGEPVFFDDPLLTEKLLNKHQTFRTMRDVDQNEGTPCHISVFDRMLTGDDSLAKPLFYQKPDYLTKPSTRKLVVMVLGRNQFHKNVDVLHGLQTHIIKLMLKSGHEVIGISPQHASQVEHMTSVELKNFVKMVILDKFGISY